MSAKTRYLWGIIVLLVMLACNLPFGSRNQPAESAAPPGKEEMDNTVAVPTTKPIQHVDENIFNVKLEKTLCTGFYAFPLWMDQWMPMAIGGGR